MSLLSGRAGLRLQGMTFLVFAIVAFAGAPALQAAKDEDPTPLLFQLSSVRPQLGLLANEMEQTLLRQAPNLSMAVVQALRDGVADSYNASALEAAILPHMRERLDREKAPTVLAWLRSPLGRRLHRLETIAASRASRVAMDSYAAEMRERPPNPQRRALTERLNAASRYTERAIDMGLSVMEAMVLALDATQPAYQRRSPAFVRAQIRTTREQALTEGREAAVAALIYTYFTVSLEDLRQLVEFAESEAGRWYYETLWGATQRAFDQVAIRLHRDLSEEVDELQSEPGL